MFIIFGSVTARTEKSQIFGSGHNLIIQTEECSLMRRSHLLGISLPQKWMELIYSIIDKQLIIIDDRKSIKNLNFRGRKVHHFQAVSNDKKLEWNLQDNLTVLKASVTIFLKIIIQLGFSSNTYCWENLKENHVHLGNNEIWILISYVL